MLKFFGYFKDGAILQRDEEFEVGGYADGEVVCTLTDGQAGGYTQRRTALPDEKGIFRVIFPAVTDTQHTFTLTAEKTDKAEKADKAEKVSVRVRFGDVYLTMGQSNMTYGLGSTENADEWLARAKKAEIAVLNMHELPFASCEEVFRPVYPLDDFSIEDYHWTDGRASDELNGISALSVQLSVLRYERTGVPVGCVHSSMGGLSVESYIPREVLEADEEVVAFTKDVGRYNAIEDYNNAGFRNFTQLSGVWNQKIAPLKGRKFKAAIWYLGESSAYDFRFGRMFLKEMQMVVRSIRAAFGEIPFVAVQIAPEYYSYGDKYGYQYINEALSDLESVEKDVFVIPTYDIEPRWSLGNGELYFHPIHPTNKQPVAKRIESALSGVREHYPRVGKVRFEGGKAILHIVRGADGEPEKLLPEADPTGFTICGEDGKYYPAKATITGEDTIELTSPDVEKAAGATYAFMQYQDYCNVRAADGAPLLAYRTTVEPVNAKYCFPPAFTKNGLMKVYENNFGIQVGNCMAVDVWTGGRIYRENNATAEGGDGEIVCKAAPGKESMYIFGCSPEICLAGHKNHLGDFEYLNFELRASEETELLGVIVKGADGEIYRYEQMNGGEVELSPSVAVRRGYHKYAVRLTRAMRGDSATVELEKEERSRFVQMEFSFRCMKEVCVGIRNVILSDKNLSEHIEKVEQNAAASREDIQLPQ